MMKKTEFIGVRITPELKNALQELADKQERTIAWIANKTLEQAILKGKVTGDPVALPDEFAQK